MPDESRRVVRLELPVHSDEDLRALRGALLAARATELAEIRRRSGRLSYGYGADSARESMRAEVGDRELRLAMVDRLLTALEKHVTPNDG